MKVWIGTDEQMIVAIPANQYEDWDLIVQLWKGKPTCEMPEDTEGALVTWSHEEGSR